MLELVPEGYEIVQIVEETWKKYAKKEKIPGFVVEKLIVRFQGIFAGIIGVDRFWKVLDIRSKIEEIPAPTEVERERLLAEWNELGIELSGGIEKIIGGAVELEPEQDAPREEPEPEPAPEIVVGPELPPELQGAPGEIVNAYLALPDLAKKEFLERIRQMNGNVKEAAASYFPEITTPSEALILVEMEDLIASEREGRPYDLDPAALIDVETLLVCEGGRRVPGDTGEWGYDDIADFIDGMHPDDRETVMEIISVAGITDEERDSLLLLLEEQLTGAVAEEEEE
jgi:hypothetical protein